jgi:predicted RNA-binding Zn ribbon-like protein
MSTAQENPAPSGPNAAPGELELVRQFVNTLDIDEGTDSLADPRGLRSWLAEHELLSHSVELSEVERERAVELREALRDILKGHTDRHVGTAAIRRLDSVIRDVPMRMRVDDTGCVRVDAAGGGFDGALGEILARTHAAMEDGSWQRLKTCADETCRWGFFDYSKNRSGHWCDMSGCGNRNKVNAFRTRKAAHLQKASKRK